MRKFCWILFLTFEKVLCGREWFKLDVERALDDLDLVRLVSQSGSCFQAASNPLSVNGTRIKTVPCGVTSSCRPTAVDS